MNTRGPRGTPTRSKTPADTPHARSSRDDTLDDKMTADVSFNEESTHGVGSDDLVKDRYAEGSNTK